MRIFQSIALGGLLIASLACSGKGEQWKVASKRVVPQQSTLHYLPPLYAPFISDQGRKHEVLLHRTIKMNAGRLVFPYSQTRREFVTEKTYNSLNLNDSVNAQDID